MPAVVPYPNPADCASTLAWSAKSETTPTFIGLRSYIRRTHSANVDALPNAMSSPAQRPPRVSRFVGANSIATTRPPQIPIHPPHPIRPPIATVPFPPPMRIPTRSHRIASKEPGVLWASDQVDLFRSHQPQLKPTAALYVMFAKCQRKYTKGIVLETPGNTLVRCYRLLFFIAFLGAAEGMEIRK